MSQQMLPTSVVVPVYNEVGNVQQLLDEIVAALGATQVPFEVVMVDDCSHDGTFEMLQSCAKRESRLKVLRHRRNGGQSSAIISGVKAARYAWVVTLDGDGQNDPKDILVLWEAALRRMAGQENKGICVTGQRTQRQDTWLRRFSSRVANGVRRWLLKDDCPDTGCSLKLFSRDAFLRLPLFNHCHRFLPALFKRAGVTVLNVPVQHRERWHGMSKYGVCNRLWVGIIDMLGVRWLQNRVYHTELNQDDGEALH